MIDEGTLRDLDILSTPHPRGHTLLEFVDRTRSRVGRDRLVHLLRAPATSAEAIVGRQGACHALATMALRCRALFDRADPDGVEEYLNSNWIVPTSARGLVRFLAGHWRIGWRSDYLTSVEKGRRRLADLLAASGELRSILHQSDAPMLQDLGREIGAALDSPVGVQLARLAYLPGRARLVFDGLARGDGKGMLATLLNALGTIEALWSLGIATDEHGWTYPRPSSRFCAQGLYHPFLGPECVPCDLRLADGVRVCFVTGPNMAGKSTFLRSVAVAMLLAHAGCGVPAASLDFPPCRTIFSSLRVSEDLRAGESFYLAEVRRIKALAGVLDEHGSVLAVLDEPLRGTNVHDAADATLAVVTRLAAHPGALVFVASHIGEVVPAIVGDRRIRLLHFAADVEDGEPRFDHRLRDGVSTQRLGMVLLRREGVLDLLERAARAGERGGGES